MIIYPLPPSELDDSTLSKQIRNIAQCLCDTYWLAGWNFLNNALYKETTLLPCSENAASCEFTKWASTCRANYLKLLEMGLDCCREDHYRFVRPVKKHKDGKYFEAIWWAKDNVPELADLDCTYCGKGYDAIPPCKEYNGKLNLCDSNHATPFPLMIHKKYLPVLIPVKFVHDEDKTEYIEYCYRNYYRAKLNKVIERGCPCMNCLCMDDKKCKLPTFTRRKPEWLNDL